MSQATPQNVATLHDFTPDENKSVFRRYIDELWNQGKVEIADEILHPDLYCHEPSFQGPTRKTDLVNIVQAFHEAFPAGNFTFTINELIAEDDKVAVWLSFRGMQKAEFAGIPSAGKELRFEVLGYYRFADGKIIEVRKHNVGHNHDFLSALGAKEQLSP